MSRAKRDAFVNAYVGKASGNATKAAILAGYSERTARQAGSRLLTYADVREAIQARQQRLQERTDVTAERVIRELALIAFSDPRQMFDEHGHLRQIHELPEDVARALASIEVTKERSRKDGDTTVEELVTKIRTWDKPKALEMLGRRLALWQDKHAADSRITVNIGFLGATPPHIALSEPHAEVMPSRPRVALRQGGGVVGPGEHEP